MPLEINQDLINEIAKRQVEMDTRWKSSDPVSPKTSSKPLMSPVQSLVVGGLADAASTYGFLKNKTGSEDNALVRALGKNDPEASAALAVGGTLGMTLLHKLLSKKFPRVADTLAGGVGGYQAAVAADNMKSIRSQLTEPETLNLNRINNREEFKLLARPVKSAARIPYRPF